MAHGSDDKVTGMARAAKKKGVEKQQVAFNPGGVPVPDEDLTEEQWAALNEISRKFMEDEDFVWDVERAW